MSILQKFKALISDPDSTDQLEAPDHSKSFEKIYALETVDLKSVRSLKKSEPTKVQTPTEKKAKKSVVRKQEPPPMKLDLGEGFCEWMPSFRLQEPLSVLGLSEQAEKALVDSSYCTLGAIVHLDDDKLREIKGIGQGHIDEIQQALADYLGDETLYHSDQIDFISFLRCLLSDQEPVVLYPLLKTYGLEELFPLSPAELVEVKHLSGEKGAEAYQKAKKLITNLEGKEKVRKNLETIVQTFIVPWMEKRLRLAKREELHERLLHVSTNAQEAESVLHLIQSVYFDGEFLLKGFLSPVSESLYAQDSLAQKDCQDLCRSLQSYFYEQTISYCLEELVGSVEREFAVRWIGFEEGWVEKCLRLSPEFLVTKHANRKDLMVKSY